MTALHAMTSSLGPETAGGKAAVLMQLIAKGFDVPAFLVLSPEALPGGTLTEAYADQLREQLPQLGPGPYAVRSAQLWLGTSVFAWLLLLTIGFFVGAPLTIGGLSALLLVVMAITMRRFTRDPAPSAQRRIDSLSGLWVLTCYLLAGAVPLLPQGLTP